MRHYIEKCSECGKIISQCRCISKDKTIIYSVCDECLKKIAEKNLNFNNKDSKITAKDDKINTSRPIRG